VRREHGLALRKVKGARTIGGNSKRSGVKVDINTLRLLRNTYPDGSMIEAIRVRNIPIGTRGIVVEVMDNGNIAVVWKNGETSVIEFGNDSVKTITEGECMLGRSMTLGGCDGDSCLKCGWNNAVAKKRMERINNGGLTTGPNGTKRLVLDAGKK